MPDAIPEVFEVGPQPSGRWWFVCHTCASDGDAPLGHETLTDSRRFAHLCLAEHEHRGHDAAVLRVA